MTTTDTTGYGSTESSGTGSDASKTDVAREQAGQVTSAAGEKAGQVAQTAVEQAKEVAAEATAQARNLAGELRTQVDEQAGTQRDRLIGSLRSVGDELEQMVQGGGSQSGIASEVATQLAERVRGAAEYLDGKQPADLLTEAQDYARRRPGAFLLGAAVAGVIAGRLMRGAKSASSDSSSTPQVGSADVAPLAPVSYVSPGDELGTGYPYQDDLGTGQPTFAPGGTSVPPLPETGTGYVAGTDSGYGSTTTTGYDQGPRP